MPKRKPKPRKRPRRPAHLRSVRRCAGGDLTGAPPCEAVKSPELDAVRAVLTAAQIEVLVWYFVDGYDMPAIGGFLGCSKVAVSLRIKLIRRKLAAAGLPEPTRDEHPTAVRRRPANRNLTQE